MLTPETLKNKTALVTGSTSGIGAGIAKRLASYGANIAFNGLGDTDENKAFAQKISEQYNIKTGFFGGDLTKEETCYDLIDKVNRTLGSVDILINNAGAQYVSPLEEFPNNKWDFLIALNLSAPFHLSKAALPLMRNGSYGRIINIASAHGLVASAGKTAYVASKHGLVGMTKVIALETAKENITANAICPGWVLTPLVQKQIDAIAAKDSISNEEASQKLLGEKQPSLTFATPEQLGGLVGFLCTDDAAQITGTTQSVDGGWTAK